MAIYFRAVAQVLPINSVARSNFLSRSVTQTLTINQTIKQNPKFGYVTTPLTISQIALVKNPKFKTVTTPLTISQTIVHIRRIINQSITHILSFGSTVNRVKHGIVHTPLVFTQSVVDTGRRIDQQLIFTQTVVGNRIKVVSHTLTINSIVTATKILRRSVSHTLNIKSEISIFRSDCKGIITGPITSLTTQNNIILTYPPITPTRTLILRVPEFGNTDALSQHRISRESRGGELIIFKDVIWPKIEQLNYQIQNLTEQQSIDLLNFLHLTVGKEIRLRDYENITWQGIILNPDSEVTQDGNCKFSFNLEFEGTIV